MKNEEIKVIFVGKCYFKWKFGYIKRFVFFKCFFVCMYGKYYNIYVCYIRCKYSEFWRYIKDWWMNLF